jgi:hypothetical protein
MINIEKTKQKFGIQTINLRPSSCKLVVWYCNSCSQEKDKKFRDAKKNNLCLNCSNKINANTNKDTRSVKMAEFWKNNIHSRLGKVAENPKPLIYKKIKVRNSWELKVAKYLDSKDIFWEYEVYTFPIKYLNNGVLTNGTYTPDFRIGNKFIEVKGRKYEVGMSKMRAFSEQYLEYTVELWDKEKLKQIGIL